MDTGVRRHLRYAKEIYQRAKYFQNKAIVRAKFHLKHDELHSCFINQPALTRDEYLKSYVEIKQTNSTALSLIFTTSLKCSQKVNGQKLVILAKLLLADIKLLKW